MQSHAPSRADDKLAARRMHLPGIPRRAKGMHRDETPFASVCGMPLAVFAIPLDSSEAGFTLDRGAQAQVSGEFLELKYWRFIHIGNNYQNCPQEPMQHRLPHVADAKTAASGYGSAPALLPVVADLLNQSVSLQDA
jgi:hypothetical protein